MKERHHNAATSIPTAPDLEIKRRGEVDGAAHARSGNHNQTVAREAGTGQHGPICISFPRLAKQNTAVERQAHSDKLRTQPLLSEHADLMRQPDEAVSERTGLSDLHCDDFKQGVGRVKQFAAEVLETQGVRCDFTALPDLERVHLTPEECDHIFLIFREALHNIAHHASCTQARFSVSIIQRVLVIEIRDNGRGLFGKSLCPSFGNRQRGHGLREMQARAVELGGALEIASAPERGTSLTLTLPLRSPAA